MSLHQYRLIKGGYINDSVRANLPRLVPYMETPEAKRWTPEWNKKNEFDPLFVHELAHVMEIFEKGQVHRLKQQNLGWPMNNFGTFTAKAATIECKVFAMHWLMEEMITGKLSRDHLLDFDSVALFMNTPRFWSRKEEFHGWASERRPALRLQDAVAEYKPKMKDLLGATVDYMVDECAEFL
jgi:hypothetical protein